MNTSSASLLQGKVIVITGAGGGIGQACALAVAQQGAQVVLVDLNAEALALAVDAVTDISEADHVLGLQLSVCDPDAMATMADQTVTRFGKIDALIACAGILRTGGSLKTVAETTLEEWNRVLNVNLTGTFLSNRAVLPKMMGQRQGDIINLSSVSGKQGRAFDGAYCASKFGIIGLSESIAEEVAAYGIRVQTLLPDAVDTPLWQQNGSQAIQAALKLPPERVAEFILYLLCLPPDTRLLNPVIAPMKTSKKARKLTSVDPTKTQTC
jgi:NAD(P)-dependent dehydrogenase (short-subunit alcohol dehydrogenase family)